MRRIIADVLLVLSIIGGGRQELGLEPCGFRSRRIPHLARRSAKHRVAVCVNRPQSAALARHHAEAVSGRGQLDLFQFGACRRFGRLDHQHLAVAFGLRRHLQVHALDGHIGIGGRGAVQDGFRQGGGPAQLQFLAVPAQPQQPRAIAATGERDVDDSRLGSHAAVRALFERDVDVLPGAVFGAGTL
ncbi:hypothetical protein [Streptomyces viridochromogenes]|uniref:hypothetical protein n=1 Tax=Streptomyces viridochromogenes TaxID=1938 RepID=UPI002E14C77C